MTDGWNVTEAHLLRRALARCVVHHPPYVVVDCAGVRARTILPALLPVAALCGRRRGVSVVLCGRAPALRALLRRVRAGRSRLYPDVNEALGALRPHHCPTGVRRAHRRLAPTPEAAAAARRLLRDCCRRWGVEESMDAGQLVISELVANAAEHAGTDIDVTVSHHRGQLRIAVADRSSRLPDPGRSRPGSRSLAERGRGLGLVANAATAYGMVTGTEGKVVWASVATPRPRRIRLPRMTVIRRFRVPALSRPVRTSALRLRPA
ncbi:ATP-binding protein [Plantactinospora sp. GCM10030261]|uniref:ATP-binding protein n=1 Tax=Plantactinospora sp. GCM10030261 TaxID=3273420 RepID=UPI00361E9411